MILVKLRHQVLPLLKAEIIKIIIETKAYHNQRTVEVILDQHKSRMLELWEQSHMKKNCTTPKINKARATLQTWQLVLSVDSLVDSWILDSSASLHTNRS